MPPNYSLKKTGLNFKGNRFSTTEKNEQRARN